MRGRPLPRWSTSACIEPRKRNAGRWTCELIAAAFLAISSPAAAVADDRVLGHGRVQDSAGQLADAEVAPFRLEIGGPPQVRFSAECRALKSPNRESKQDKRLTFVDQAPAQFDVGGSAVECFVRKIKGEGTITVVLRRGDGIPIASSTLTSRKRELRLRSVGPWGTGGVRVLNVP
jgi:hypothetical protein